MTMLKKIETAIFRNEPITSHKMSEEILKSKFFAYLLFLFKVFTADKTTFIKMMYDKTPTAINTK